MRQFFINWFCSFGFGLVFATCAIGQPANQSPPKPVEALLKVFLIGKNAEGKEVRLAADKASPGDVLEYQTVYQNNGKATVKLLTATGANVVDNTPRSAGITTGLSVCVGPQA